MFKFNGSYQDLKQVSSFYADFIKVYKELEKKGKYTYNSLFKGKIKGLKDNEDENTAIYLLQQLETEKSRERKIKDLVKQGYKEIIKGQGIKKFKRVVLVGTDYSKDSTKEFEKARIVFDDKGYIKGILPKGHTRTGISIYCDRKVYAI